MKPPFGSTSKILYYAALATIDDRYHKYLDYAQIAYDEALRPLVGGLAEELDEVVDWNRYESHRDDFLMFIGVQSLDWIDQKFGGQPGTRRQIDRHIAKQCILFTKEIKKDHIDLLSILAEDLGLM